MQHRPILDVLHIKQIERKINRKLTNAELLQIWEAESPLTLETPSGDFFQVTVDTFTVADLTPSHVSHEKIRVQEQIIEAIRRKEEMVSRDKIFVPKPTSSELKHRKETKKFLKGSDFKDNEYEDGDILKRKVVPGDKRFDETYMERTCAALHDLESREEVEPLDSFIIMEFAAFGLSDGEISKRLQTEPELGFPAITDESVRKRRHKTLERSGMEIREFSRKGK